MRPGVHGTHDLPPSIGVGAGVLARAAVADVRLGAVANQPPLVVELVRPQVLTLRALPVVVLVVVGEARGPIAQRAAVRVGRQPLDHRRGEQEEAGVASDEDDLRAHGVFAAAASSPPVAATPSGSTISVKRMSSGSSRVTRLTVCRMPT